MPIAREKLADLQRSLAVVRSQELHVAEALIDQLQAAQDECAEKDVAQLGIGANQFQQRLPGDFDHLTRRARLDAGEEAPTGEDRSLASEHPFAEGRHILAHPARVADDVEPSRHDDEDLCDGLPRLAEHLTRLNSAVPATGLDAGDLRRREPWKSFGLSRGGGWRRWDDWGSGGRGGSGHDLNTSNRRKSFQHGPAM